ncbi:hypothetical protein FRB94_011507 [Tulasnella sp. JGI-2019a]|nr:hypothetical protein FRB94_011507 [Tulasnella sp. JGI-2019a]KAG9006714.1 hypothetical protein FRB93_008446 [Tulasnella sp. JGI-2019a]KAG9033070.1 hypothetical protein FRB95_000574 [Tulasnella sp. JGI-2019a]
MPTVIILNETKRTLHIAMLTGVPYHFDNHVAPGGMFRREYITSTPWAYEARIPQHGNEYSSGDSLGRVGALAGGIAAGTASVILGSFWALGSFGGHFNTPGRVAVGSAGGLMRAASEGGSAFARWGPGVVLRKDWWMVGFEDLTYAIREVDGNFDLVEVRR